MVCDWLMICAKLAHYSIDYRGQCVLELFKLKGFSFLSLSPSCFLFLSLALLLFSLSLSSLSLLTPHHPVSPTLSFRQVSKSDGSALATRFGCLFFEVSACLDFQSVQRVFHEAVREARHLGGKRSPPLRPLYISEDNKPLFSLATVPPFTTPCYKELPVPATAKLVTVKSSRAQSKRRAPTLTLLKGFKIFWWVDGEWDQT